MAKINNFFFKFLEGCATLPNVPKLGVFGVEDTAKTNKDSGT